MALICNEAQDQHDPEHVDELSEALSSLQKQLTVSSTVPHRSRVIRSSVDVFVKISALYLSDCVALQIKDGEVVCVRELVGKCLAEYAATKCSRPNCQRLRWTISGRTARQLKHSYYRITHLPTIPESAC